ncbi:MAG: hypothetical protein FGM23_02105 [Alphaproteobacteria bacterium]|nr:hypothetical protein [Alphaproteobacteria bacterium]
MRAEPYPTYANAATGLETILNIMDAEITGDQTWRFVADENAPGYVKGVAAALNAAGSTWDHVNQGGWAATDAAFNFANWVTATNAADAELIKAMMALFEEATALGMSPVKASMAVMLANMYPGIRVEFNYTTPQAAAQPQQSQNGGNGDRPGEDQYSQYSAGTSTPEGEDPNANSPYMIGDFGEVAAQNGR